MAEIVDAHDESVITLGEVTLDAVWNVRGNAADVAFASAVSRALGLALPAVTTSTCGEGAALLWLGPRSWLYVGGDSSTAGDFDAIRRATNAAGGALFDVSSAHVAWRVAGAAASRLLNRACPLDLHPLAFAKGRVAQSVLGHVNALFHKPDDASFVVIVARSFAADGWHTLCQAAATDGYRIVAPCTFFQATRAT